MDLQSPPTTTTPTTTTTTPTTTNPVKNLDPDPRTNPNTDPKQHHLPPPFTNGVLKRLKPRLHTNPVVITYKECLKNHAATMGGHAVDGCGEFMPSMTSSPTDPTSLKCAACGCHRNFHRREPDGSFSNITSPVQHVIEYQPHHRHHPPPPQPLSVAGAREQSISPTDSPSPPPISSSYYPSAPHMLLALSSGLPAPPSENTNTHYSIPVSNNLIGSVGSLGSNSTGKKRFRTKFTQDQKEKMHELAEQVGWKMQKKDEELIINICNEIGVDKGVFKVWMHNNKMTFGKKDESHHVGNNGSSSGGGGVDFFNIKNNQFQLQQQFQQQQQPQQNDSGSSGDGDGDGDGDGNGMGANGSSSSS